MAVEPKLVPLVLQFSFYEKHFHNQTNETIPELREFLSKEI